MKNVFKRSEIVNKEKRWICVVIETKCKREMRKQQVSKRRQKYKNQILVVKKSTLNKKKKNGKKRSISAKPVIPRARLLLFPIIRCAFDSESDAHTTSRRHSYCCVIFFSFCLLESIEVMLNAGHVL